MLPQTKHEVPPDAQTPTGSLFHPPVQMEPERPFLWFRDRDRRVLLLFFGAGFPLNSTTSLKNPFKFPLTRESLFAPCLNCAQEVVECRRQTAASLIKLIRLDSSLCLSSHASPVLQLLLRLLRDCHDRALLAEAAGRDRSRFVFS